MTIVRDFLERTEIDPAARAVDVGSGTNLYPALAMLPFCASMELIEYSTANVIWLRRQVPRFGDSWDDFWRVYAESEVYALVALPRAAFARKVSVRQGSVFTLPAQAWDLGTMFFVACSLSTDQKEFRRAIHCFTRSLTPDAPFAMAFMARSEGYLVRDRWFPAVRIGVDDVHECLESVAYDVTVSPIDIGDPLRDGYGGMIVATGRRGSQR